MPRTLPLVLDSLCSPAVPAHRWRGSGQDRTAHPPGGLGQPLPQARVAGRAQRAVTLTPPGRSFPTSGTDDRCGRSAPAARKGRAAEGRGAARGDSGALGPASFSRPPWGAGPSRRCRSPAPTTQPARPGPAELAAAAPHRRPRPSRRSPRYSELGESAVPAGGHRESSKRWVGGAVRGVWNLPARRRLGFPCAPPRGFPAAIIAAARSLPLTSHPEAEPRRGVAGAGSGRGGGGALRSGGRRGEGAGPLG